MLIQVSLSLFAMIGSTHTHTQGSGARSSSQTLASPASVSKNTPCIAQITTATPLPHTPTLSIPEIHITPPPSTSDSHVKPSKRERFKASVKGVFHKSDGSLLPSKHTTSISPLEADQPKLSKRERLSQIFTTEKSKAQTVYFEEGHPLLAPKPKNQSKEEKLSKRKRLSQLLKTDKQLAKEAYYADEAPPTPKNKSRSRPQSEIFTKSLDQRLASPPSSRRNSLDTPALTTQAHPQTPTSPALPPPRLEIFPYPSQEDNLPPRSETKALESPEHTPPGSLQDLLRQNTQLTPPPPSQFSFFEDLDKRSEDSLLAEARAFKDNRANYSIPGSQSEPSSLLPNPPSLNPCCKTIVEHFQSYLHTLSSQSLPNLPSQTQPIHPSCPLPIASVRSSQNSKTSTLAETITVDLDHYKLDSPLFLKELSQFAQELVKYSGLVGDLVSLGKHTWVLTHTHASMTLYLCPKRIQCRPHTVLTSIIESKRSNKGLNYKEVNTETLKNARKLSTPYTLAYAQSIRKHLHWKTTLAKFIGSCVAVSGIFTIFLSSLVEEFNPALSFSLYGYYLLAVSMAFFALNKSLKAVSSHSLSCKQERQLSLYRELSKNTPSLSLYGSIPLAEPLNEPDTHGDLQSLTLDLIRNNFDFALRHLLESLKAEQERPQDAEALFPQVLTDPGQYIHNPEGPTYMFLKATLGLKKSTLNLLLKEYKKDSANARRLLQELLLDSKLLTT